MSATARNREEDQEDLNALFELKPTDGAIIDYINDRLEVLTESNDPRRVIRAKRLLEEMAKLIDGYTAEIEWRKK
jgi:hypothetical protein